MADKRDITVDVTIRSDTKGAREASTALGEVDKSAGKTGVSMKDMGAKADIGEAALKDLGESAHDVASEVEHAGKSMSGMGADAKALEQMVARSKETIKDLETELTKLGNNPGIRKSLRVERSWLAELEKVGKDLGTKTGSGFASSIGSAVAGAGPVVQGALVGALVAAAPVVGAIVGGAITGGIGTGAMAAGLLAAAKDDRVEAALHTVGEDLSKQFTNAGLAFVGPAVKGLELLDRTAKSIDLTDTLAKAAPSVETMAKGISDLVTNAMPGVNKLLDRVGPFADVAAEGLAGFGSAAGEFLDDVSDSKGAIEGLETAFDLLNGTVVVAGKVIYGLEQAYDAYNVSQQAVYQVTAELAGVFQATAVEAYAKKFADGFDRTRDAADGASGHIHAFGDEIVRVKLGLDPMGTSASVAGQAVDDLAAAVDRAFQVQLGIDNASIAWERSLDDLTQSVKDNGTTLDITSEKGRANAQQLLDGVAAAQKQRQANIDSGMSAGDAALQYDAQIKKLEVLATKLGISKKALEGIVGDYEINITTTERHNIIETHSEDHRMYGPGGNPSGRASGGEVMAGVPYTINERGSETVTFPAGGTVHPAHLTPTGGGGNVTWTVMPGGSGVFENLLAELIRKFVRIEGGGSVQAAYGQ